MATRKGTLLEQNVETIFSSAGFNTDTNIFLSDYEIDVHAELGDIEIIAECKQYEKSNLQTRNLIHEWKGKNEHIGADIILIVIYGQEITAQEKELAQDKGIIIWDEDKVNSLLEKDSESLREQIFSQLPLEKKSLGETNKNQIERLVWKPYLEGNKINEGRAHEELLLMIKERIRRELFQEGTTIQERNNHIDTFEEVKKSGIVRSKVDIKNSKKKFDKIMDKMDNGDSMLETEKERKYHEFMKSVKGSFEEAKVKYLDSQGYKQVKRIVKARLKFLMRHGGGVELSPRKAKSAVNASRTNGKISLDFEISHPGDLETIRWILMKEGEYKRKETEARKKHQVSFKYEDIDEATDAFIRIITEYHNHDLQKIRLVDKNKDDLSKGQNLFAELLK